MQWLSELMNIYDADTARETAPRIEERVTRLREWLQAHPARPPAPIDQRTAILITYGDQVTAPDEMPLATLSAFLDAHASALTGVHVLPFYPYSSDDGFSVMDYNAVDPRLGTWDDIARLGGQFELMFDAVINHASVQGKWFAAFLKNQPPYNDFFFVPPDDFDTSRVIRPRALPLLTTFETAAGPKRVWTTFSADQADLNYANPELFLQILDVLLFYVRHGARLVRLDAIAFLWKESGTTCLHLPQTHAVIRLMRALLNATAPGTVLVTETNVPHADNISYFGDGANEAQWVYNFALPPLTLHTLQTGDASALARWAQSLRTPSAETAFFNFLASHDGVGLNPARGILSEQEIEELVARTLARGGLISYKTNPDGSRSPYEMNINYLDALIVPGEAEELAQARFICAHAIAFALAGVPGIYFHSFFGSRGDRAGAESSGIPRRINRQKTRRADLEAELGDPHSRRARIHGQLSELLRVRGEHAAFHPHAAQTILAREARVFAVLRGTGDAQVLCLHNVTGETVPFREEELGARRWRVIADAASADLAPPHPIGTNVIFADAPLELMPYEVVWLAS